MRASSVPTLYACCLNKRSCNFLLQGSAFGVDFAILRSHFWYRQTVPKNGTVKVLFFCSFTKLRMWSQKWDRQAVPFLGPPGGPIFGTVFRFMFFKFFVSGLQKCNVLVSL